MSKKILFYVVLILIAFSLPIVTCEVAYRTYHFFKFTAKGNSVQRLELDAELGWKPTDSYVFKGERRDRAGVRYAVDIQTDERGFRLYGDRDTNKVKIFFIGDSYTYAMDVSNNKTYYSLFTDKLPVESFVYGSSGYGTLQEYMILDKYLDEIRPDIVILQCSSNDFINNSYELEARSRINNNKMRRPYYSPENRIHYELPKEFPGFRGMINEYSRFLYKIVGLLDRLINDKEISVEKIIVKQQGELPAFKDSIRTTGRLLKKIRDRAAGSEVYTFCSDHSSPYYKTYMSLAEEAGITLIDGVSQAVKEVEAAGGTTRALDGAHWNELGHQIVADRLVDYFVNRI